MTKVARKAQIEVEQILRHLAERERGWSGCWKIQRLGQGDQAHLFLGQIESKATADRLADEVVIKLYKHTSSEDRQAFLSEKRCLEDLRAALQEIHCKDWSLRSPKLYYACEDRLALVMSTLPGVSLDRWLQSSQISLTTYSSVARAVLAALQVLWSKEIMYGDLNLKNILCDPTTLSLGFIDPGLPNELFRCDHVSRDGYPASRDLAYLLYSVAVSVKSTLGSPASRCRQLLFVNLLIRQYVDSITSRSRQARLLEEIQHCTEAHLQSIKCDWSAPGLWRRLVKHITRSSLNTALAELAVASQEAKL